MLVHILLFRLTTSLPQLFQNLASHPCFAPPSNYILILPFLVALPKPPHSPVRLFLCCIYNICTRAFNFRTVRISKPANMFMSYAPPTVITSTSYQLLQQRATALVTIKLMHAYELFNVRTHLTIFVLCWDGYLNHSYGRSAIGAERPFLTPTRYSSMDVRTYCTYCTHCVRTERIVHFNLL